MKKSNILLASLLLAGALLCDRSASAQVEVYDTGSSYDAASFTDQVDQFDGSVQFQNSFNFYGNAFTVGGMGNTEYTTPTGTSIFVLGPGVAGYDFPNDDSASLNAQPSLHAPAGTNAVLDISLPSNVLPDGISAIGTEIGDAFGPASITAVLTFTNNQTATYTFTVPDAYTSGLDYMGFVTSGGLKIASLSITDTALDEAGIPDLVVDNFSYGVGNPNGPSGTPLLVTPEPSSLALIGVGAFALLVFRRRLALI